MIIDWRCPSESRPRVIFYLYSVISHSTIPTMRCIARSLFVSLIFSVSPWKNFGDPCVFAFSRSICCSCNFSRRRSRTEFQGQLNKRQMWNVIAIVNIIWIMKSIACLCKSTGEGNNEFRVVITLSRLIQYSNINMYVTVKNSFISFEIWKII